MLGAIIGDIVGSGFEWNTTKLKDFDLLTYKCKPTENSIMTLAIAKALLESESNYSNLSRLTVEWMQKLGRKYPNAGYGDSFCQWLMSDDPKPHNTNDIEAAMRVSPCAYFASDLEEAKRFSYEVARVTHNHPEGIKAAEAVTIAIFMALHGSNILEIQDHILKHYYDIDFKLADIRDSYEFNVICQGSVPQALEAFFESNSFEDAIRNAISICRDNDTITAITGGIAEAYYGIPADIRKQSMTYLDKDMLDILIEFENKYPSKLEVLKKGNSVSIPITYKVEQGTREQMLINSVNSSDLAIESTMNENKSISSQQLFNHIYESCNKLYGKVPKESYKSYIIPLLFFKRISDIYDEEYQNALDESGGDEDYAALTIHKFKIPDGCHWNDVRNKTENIGFAIFNAMSGIEKTNPDQLSGIFDAFRDATWTDKSKLPDTTLKNLVEHMSELKFGNKNYSADCMGDAYEFLIKKFADLAKANAGAFYTPRSIVNLLVRLLNPKAGESVYDPACGTGGMLIGAINYMQNDKLSYGKIYGQDNIKATASIARMNLFLHGASDFQIAKGDTLCDPKFIENGKLKTFDCVIANPPFSLKNWGSSIFEFDKYGRNIWGTPTDSSADFAWIQHMVKSMKPGTGRCALVIAQGVLFHSGAEGKMRQQLVESDILEAVITLRSGIFFATGVNACILLLNNNKKAAHRNKVCLIDGSEVYTSKRAQDILTPENVDRLYNLYADYSDEIDFAKVVSIDEIKAKDYTLSVNTYIEKTKKKVASPKEVKARYFEAYQDMLECENAMIELLKKGGYINE